MERLWCGRGHLGGVNPRPGSSVRESLGREMLFLNIAAHPVASSIASVYAGGPGMPCEPHLCSGRGLMMIFSVPPFHLA